MSIISIYSQFNNDGLIVKKISIAVSSVLLSTILGACSSNNNGASETADSNGVAGTVVTNTGSTGTDPSTSNTNGTGSTTGTTGGSTGTGGTTGGDGTGTGGTTGGDGSTGTGGTGTGGTTGGDGSTGTGGTTGGDGSTGTGGTTGGDGSTGTGGTGTGGTTGGDGSTGTGGTAGGTAGGDGTGGTTGGDGSTGTGGTTGGDGSTGTGGTTGGDGSTGTGGTAGGDGSTGTGGTTGGGSTGFPSLFVKLGVDGSELPADADTWSCILDTKTGLIWEVKTNDGGLRDKDWRYQYDGSSGLTPAGTEYPCTGIYACNAISYIEALNTYGVCGKTDWHLPTDAQMSGIGEPQSEPPHINLAAFPNFNTDLPYCIAKSNPGHYQGIHFGIEIPEGAELLDALKVNMSDYDFQCRVLAVSY